MSNKKSRTPLEIAEHKYNLLAQKEVRIFESKTAKPEHYKAHDAIMVIGWNELDTARRQNATVDTAKK